MLELAIVVGVVEEVFASSLFFRENMILCISWKSYTGLGPYGSGGLINCPYVNFQGSFAPSAKRSRGEPRDPEDEVTFRACFAVVRIS